LFEKVLFNYDLNMHIRTYCMSHACHYITVMSELVRGKNICIALGLWCWLLFCWSCV